MSSFLPLVEKSYEFEGDTVAVSFKRLTRQQMMGISPFIPGEGVTPTPEDQMKLVDASIECLKTNIDKFEGLNNADLVSIPFDDAVDQAYFMNFISEIAMDLITASMVQEKK